MSLLLPAVLVFAEPASPLSGKGMSVYLVIGEMEGEWLKKWFLYSSLETKEEVKKLELLVVVLFWILASSSDSTDENGVETSVEVWEPTGVEEGFELLAPASVLVFKERVGGLSEREFDLCMCTNRGLKIGGGGKNAENFLSCSFAVLGVVILLVFMLIVATATFSCFFMLSTR